ncbi:flagellar basal body rod protein FlgB [Desulfitobacterium sp.]|uniref:flagellar basal body rod protein FlgB n=1 Tax=Desulfitobacterium sp. TaxID=49981 RepID=UPI002B21A4FA|nr:flagellar basal body rod protein FlgB [Desulfitobacterium sp.]MEA4900863.1 flagellar basal body rod protein FlgB [Desulfitobacterium sp.]
MSGWLDSPIMALMETGLDASSLRQKVLSNNVANVDTPNFKRSDVDFQQILGEALGEPPANLPLKVTSPQHIQGVQGSVRSGVVKDNSTTLRNDGNNVDIDKEMADVAENGLYYNSMTQAISNELGFLRTAIDAR